MYRERIKEAKTKLGISAKSMSLLSELHVQEETISRFLSGKTADPGVNVTLDLGATVGLKPYEIFMDEETAVEFAAFLELRAHGADYECHRIQIDAENESIRCINKALSDEIELLRIKLQHREEIIEHKDRIISLYERLEKLCSDG